MEFDGVDALASHIEGMQNRRVAIREAGVLKRGRRAQSSSRAEQVGCGRPGPFTMHRLLQCLIGGEEVVLRQGRRLVKDRVGGRGGVHGSYESKPKRVGQGRAPMRSVPRKRTYAERQRTGVFGRAIAPNGAPVLDSAPM